MIFDILLVVAFILAGVAAVVAWTLPRAARDVGDADLGAPGDEPLDAPTGATDDVFQAMSTEQLAAMIDQARSVAAILINYRAALIEAGVVETVADVLTVEYAKMMAAAVRT